MAAIPGTIPASMAEHWDVLWIICVGLVILLLSALSVGVGETLRRIVRIERKQDEQAEVHSKCKEELLDRLLDRSVFVEWKRGRRQIKKALISHIHANNGSAIIKEPMDDE